MEQLTKMWKIRRSHKRWRIFDVQRNLGKIWHEKYGWLSRSLFKKRCFLLADVFEKFIDTCLNFHGLDPCHYYSSPGLSWDAMLKISGVKLEKISDIDIYLFIEKEMRGGISYITRIYAKANKKSMKNYDPK